MHPPMKRPREQEMVTITIKQEPITEDMIAVKTLKTENLPSAVTGDDFNWSSIASRDLDLETIRIKQEQQERDRIANSITSLSPPMSDPGSNDETLQDFLGSDVNDCTEALDLTVHGQSIAPPDWWAESLTKSMFLTEQPSLNLSSGLGSGLNTPIAASPVPQNMEHPWAESKSDIDEAIANFDLDLQNLFEEEESL